jgi:ferric-dicitrate binding protein FerR (iron transport regulator)
MTNEAQYLELMSKYLSGNITPAERQDLLSWAESSAANKAFFDEIIQLWSISGTYEQPAFEVDPEQAWLNFEPRLDEPKAAAPNNTVDNTPAVGGGGTKIVPFGKNRRFWRVAAAIAAIITLGTFGFYQVFQPNNYMEVITQAGERQEVLLPDGSKVLLNQDSKLAYQTKFKQREVKLEGEAFFDVASIPDRPFAITSGAVVTTVLGTAFNVRAYPDEAEVEVVVAEGLVQVETTIEKAAATAPIQLKPGEAVKYDKEVQTLEETEVEIAEATIWREASLAFDDVSISEIARIIERYYNIEIELDEQRYNNCPYSIDKIIRPKLDEIFSALRNGLDIEVEELQPGKYRFTGGMCE